MYLPISVGCCKSFAHHFKLPMNLSYPATKIHLKLFLNKISSQKEYLILDMLDYHPL